MKTELNLVAGMQIALMESRKKEKEQAQRRG